jgi:uncharacterized repeat protein (TIGR01451 family)
MRAAHKLTHTHLTLSVLLLLAAGWLCLPARHNALPGGAAAPLQGGPVLSLTKADSPDPVTAGSNITYTITFGNSGPVAAPSPSLSDNVPTNTTFVSLNVNPSAGWTCTTPAVGAGPPGMINCNANQLAANSQVVFTLVVQVAPGTPVGTVITNVATASAFSTPMNAIATTTVGAPQADLSVTKTGPATAVAGQNISYTITAANAGPNDASNVVLNDALPANTTFQSLTVPAGWTCTTPAVNATGAVNCTRATFTAGASNNFTLVVRLNANVACDTGVNNQATIASATADPTPGNNTSSATPTAQAQSDLAIISAGAPNPVAAGGTVTYTLTVTNNGPSDSANTQVTDTLPPGFTANSATPSAGTCNGAGTGTVNCMLGTLAVGGTATITIAAHVPAICQPTTAVNTATVTSGNCLPDPQLGNNTTNFNGTVSLPTVGPGACIPNTVVNDTLPGSVLDFPFYTSSASNSNDSNTRIALTNTHPTLGVALHLFFVDGATCGVADAFVCLTANQTAVFLMSDIDPGVSGYMIAIAVDGPPGFAEGGNTGCPISFNFLIGHTNIKMPTAGSSFASFGNSALVPTKRTRVEAEIEAEAVPAEFGSPLPGCNANSVTAELRFDGSLTGYGLLPRVLAASNIPSRADGNSTLLVINRIGGSLATGAATLGTLFGILYDDAENGYSFQLSGACQLRGELSNSFPRTAPRFDALIPAGRSGWLKIYGVADIAILGATINNNVNSDSAANAFDGGHNLHKLRLTSSAVLTVPIFPPNC